MTTAFDPEPAAAALHAARAEHRASVPLPHGIAPTTDAEGLAVQRALAIRFGAERPGGFKIGATAPTMQSYLGLSGPIASFMRREAIHESGAVLRWDDFRRPGTECEIGVRLATDLPPAPCDVATARAAVGELFAAIEIVENRYDDALTTVGTPLLIADQVFNAAAVLGEPSDWSALDLAAIPGRILVDGTVRGEGRGGDLLGHPLNALAWLAGSAEAAAFGGLRAGQAVMLGSVTPPIWLDRPCIVTVEFGGLKPCVLRLT